MGVLSLGSHPYTDISNRATLPARALAPNDPEHQRSPAAKGTRALHPLPTHLAKSPLTQPTGPHGLCRGVGPPTLLPARRSLLVGKVLPRRAADRLVADSSGSRVRSGAAGGGLSASAGPPAAGTVHQVHLKRRQVFLLGADLKALI